MACGGKHMALLGVKEVSLSYGSVPLLDRVTLNIERGDRICLLGVNGTGKSSFLRVLAGETTPDSGELAKSAGLRVARLPQQVPTHLKGRVLDIVHPGHAQDEDGELLLEAEQIIDRLDLDQDADFESLSGGTRRRVLLAHALLGSPDLVLLDEPTNHLDVDSIAWLEGFLLRSCKSFLFVTHDRAFLRRLATRIVELDRGHLRDWTCDYDTFLRRKEDDLAAEEKQWAAADKKLREEEAWRRRGVKARRTRNEGRVRALEGLREQRRQRREHGGSVRMSIQEANRTGHIVVKSEGVNFGYGGRPLIRDFSTVITRGDRVGILGPNGCGKTTLLRLLLEAGVEGGLRPASGRIVHGTNLQVAYSDQLRGQLDDKLSVVENIAEGRDFVQLDGGRRHVIGYLQDFLFTLERARQPVGSLSGGERNRLLLARLFAQPSNVLVLDEPTNDLDLDALDVLEEQLGGYSGTVLMVSHDRAFLNNVVTSTLVFEKAAMDRPDVWLGPNEGWYINEYVGGYADWVARRLRPPAPAAPVKAAPPPPPRQEPARRRLSYKERTELDAMPGRIEALEAEQAQWHAQMIDPMFYRRADADMVAQAKSRTEAIGAELASIYKRWEELTALAEVT